MRVIFVDAENLGHKFLESLKTNIKDKVLVFSHDQAVKALCQKRSYTLYDDYPTGSNQADFNIIAVLASMTANSKPKDHHNMIFEIHSKDKALTNAFVYQCELIGLKNKVVPSQPESYPPKDVEETQPEQPSKVLEDSIIKALKTPIKLAELEKNLKVTRSNFSRAINNLVKSKQICKVDEKKKYWRLAS